MSSAWMAAAVDLDVLRDRLPPLPSSPWAAAWRDGAPVAVFTDGHVIAWGPVADAGPKPEGAPAIVPEWWGPEPTEWRTVSRAALLAWCSTTPMCDRCAGTRQIPHDCGCSLCKAETEPCWKCDVIRGSLPPAVVNVEKLARVVDAMDAETLRLSVKSDRIEIRGASRGAILMPMRNGSRNGIPMEIPVKAPEWWDAGAALDKPAEPTP